MVFLLQPTDGDADKDSHGQEFERGIWPIMLGFVKSRRFIAGWCELRDDFRLFCADGRVKVIILDDHCPRNRRQLRAKEDLRDRQGSDGYVRRMLDLLLIS